MQALWSLRIVSRDELIDDILTPIYAYIESFTSREVLLRVKDEAVPISPHRLAILLFVLATGTLLDFSIPPYSPEAQELFDMGKACLSFSSVLDSSELATVQALYLAAHYTNHGGPEYSPEVPSSLLGLCTRLAHKVT